MSWKRRLAELTLAGGLVTAGGCFSPEVNYDAGAPETCAIQTGPNGVCNANPDPCCCALDMAACAAYRKRDLAVAPHD
jgi:hypothetical protein